MGYVLDAVVILLFVCMILRGRKIGFMKSILGLAGVIAALVLAFTLSKPLAKGIYGAFVQDSIVSGIQTAVDDVGTSVDGNLQAAQEALPSFVQSLMEKSNFSLSDITVDSAGAQTAGESVATAVEQQVVQPIVTLLLRYVVGIILLLVLLVVAGILTRLISKIVRVTPLKSLDGLLGGVLGAVKGVIFVLVLVTAVQIIAGFTAADALISADTIEQSLLFGWLADHNPVFAAGESILTQAKELLVHY